MFVAMDEQSIQFIQEVEWADGSPLVEGSPAELAVGWMSELGLVCRAIVPQS